jgi:hypothetical protein
MQSSFPLKSATSPARREGARKALPSRLSVAKGHHGASIKGHAPRTVRVANRLRRSLDAGTREGQLTWNISHHDTRRAGPHGSVTRPDRRSALEPASDSFVGIGADGRSLAGAPSGAIDTESKTLATKPNFFIVGAPKCGTTALYEYLRPHPNIFMPTLKEPHFFASDLGSYPPIRTLQEYTKIFAGSSARHLRIGEASVYYLRSSVAIANIRDFNPDARIIAMFRNPVEMVHSLHSQLLYVSEESEPDFERAWRLQERRRQGFDLPPASRGAFLLQYAEVGQFGTQTQRLLSIFPRAQVKLILFDDFAASPQQVYDELIEFLDIPHDKRTGFPRINENKRARITWLKDFARKPPPALHQAFRTLKQALGAEGISAVKRRIVQLNTVKERRHPLSPAFRAELVDAFRDEVALLSQLVNRDLSHWI